MGEILPAIMRHRSDVITYGYKRPEVAMEYNTSHIKIVWDKRFNIAKEALEVINFYGEGFDDKYLEEQEHYKFLTHGLLHKIRSTKYFHGQGLGSRKLIIFSDDCISSIHLLVRPEAITLNVYMRSSDITRLLPVDVLAMARLLARVINEYDIDLFARVAVLNIIIGSAHIVTNDDLEKAIYSLETY